MFFARWWQEAAQEPRSSLPFSRTDVGALRAPLLSADALESHAAQVCSELGATTASGAPLLRYFEQARRELTASHRRIAAAASVGAISGGEAEWLLDNYHIIAEALKEVTTGMPPGYYRRLPKATGGSLAGYPCTLALAVDLVAHCDAALDETSLDRYLTGCQRVRWLTLGELWAFPTMLRLALLENLRRLAWQILKQHEQKELAHEWGRACRQGTVVDLPAAMDSSFAIQACDFLTDEEPLRSRLEVELAARGTPLAELRRAEQQRQAADQVSIGNSVTSLRLLSAIQWTPLVERHSVVEQTLRQDPSAVYGRQDQRTRDRCRQLVEELAEPQGREEGVASAALSLARASRAGIGRVASYYLLGGGRAHLEAEIGYRPRWHGRLKRWLTKYPTPCYFAALTLTTIGLAGAVLAWAAPAGWAAALLAILLIVPASEMAVQLVHRLITMFLPPRHLPRFDYRYGLPADCATFVVIPGMLGRVEDAKNLADRLEVHFHAAREPEFRFALLTDFADAQEQDRPEDSRLLEAVFIAIRQLNERYAPGEPDRFFVFHRQRRWNDAEGCWMGWERKRGKLLEFNRLLRGATHTSYLHRSGEVVGLPRTQYVITLDADTQLPRESAQRLVAALAHPLNRPQFDAAGQRVVAGYAILQPRVSFTMSGAAQSLFARLFSVSPGVDPYAVACSDAYQDLFGAGSFTGKGIYDVDAFERACGMTFPENAILSHDLIESNYARCGLCTDTEFFDHFPARYLAYARREHRWIRGDWQLLPWLGRGVPRPDGQRTSWVANPLPALERWKILDNLRRSLLAPALVLLLLSGWLLQPEKAWLWSSITFVVCLWPVVLQSGFAAISKIGRPSEPVKFGASLRESLPQGVLKFSLLLDQAVLALDALGRTLFRLFISRRRLLEWETAASTERRFGNEPLDFAVQLWPAWLLPLALAALVWLFAHAALPAAALVLAVFAFAPLVAWWLSQAPVVRPPRLTATEVDTLRRLARRTWGYYEAYVTAEDHWLPPDNFQEWPKGSVAHRTSPTNIGFYLVSCLAAHDLGYLTLSRLVERLENTFATLDRLPRHSGHFVNWHDTQTLAALLPAYVSTVDSGNLCACLLVLKAGLEDAANSPNDAALVAGLQDTLAVASDSIRVAGTTAAIEIQRELDRLAVRLAALSCDLMPHLDVLRDLAATTGELTNKAGAGPGELAEPLFWLEALQLQIEDGATAAQQNATEVELLAERCRALAARADLYAHAMDFTILYSDTRRLFSVGYNLTQGKLDTAHYDLLASEASLTSFLAIAKGDAPRRHWFQLGRPLAPSPGGPVLISWSGTMFEYLMPQLFLPTLPESLLRESSRAAILTQIDYARRLGLPWGVSESAYAKTDGELNYQYQAFGVPSLGLKRGLGRDHVIAPYASMLALSVVPKETLANFRRLEAEGAKGQFGFYEAIDYTPDRLAPGSPRKVVKCFMAHHQGMGLCALANFLKADCMVRRFARHPEVKSTELLLQERVPTGLSARELDSEEAPDVQTAVPSAPILNRRLTTPHTGQPRVHLLGNGGNSLVISNAGSNRSRRGNLDLIRWREDATLDCCGQFLYFKDLNTGRTWSGGHQPLCQAADEYEVTFAADKAEFRRVDGDIQTLLEIALSPEDGTESWRVRLSNHGRRARDIEVLSYGEVVLLPHDADLAHPAFGKLFVETEYLKAEHALLFRRRPREAGGESPWLVHVVAAEGTEFTVTPEVDRGRFLGRGRGCDRPQALEAMPEPGQGLLATLDPIFSLRGRIRVPAGGSALLAYSTSLAASREEAMRKADQFHDLHSVNRLFELAWAHSQVELRHLHLSSEEVQLFQRLAGHLLFAQPAFRAPAMTARSNRLGLESLWGQGVSGDLPLLVVQSERLEQVPHVRQFLDAHRFWRHRGLESDLLILNTQQGGYYQELQEELNRVIHAREERAVLDQRGGIYLRQAAQLPAATVDCLLAAARCFIDLRRGPLVEQLERLDRLTPPPPQRSLAPRASQRAGSQAQRRRRPLAGVAAASWRPGFRVGLARPSPWRTARLAARALDQRRCQSPVWLHGIRGRLHVHLGRQQPDQSPDAVEQRPGPRSLRRGHLPPR